MTWDEIMAERPDGGSAYADCRRMAVTWSGKAKGVDVDDLTQDLAIYLFEKVDPSRAKGTVKSYIAGALWNAASGMVKHPRATFYRELQPLSHTDPDIFEPQEWVTTPGDPDGPGPEPFKQRPQHWSCDCPACADHVPVKPRLVQSQREVRNRAKRAKRLEAKA